MTTVSAGLFASPLVLTKLNRYCPFGRKQLPRELTLAELLTLLRLFWKLLTLLQLLS